MSIVKRHISGTNDYFLGFLRLPSHAAHASSLDILVKQPSLVFLESYEFFGR